MEGQYHSEYKEMITYSDLMQLLVQTAGTDECDRRPEPSPQPQRAH